MASGDVSTVGSSRLAEQPLGFVVTSSGRVSGVTEPGELSVHYPFPNLDLVVLDNALKYGSRNAHARFAVYIGDLGTDTAATARELLSRVPTPDNAVLLAVSVCTTNTAPISPRESARSAFSTASGSIG